jgi:hypothetical protein
MFFCAMMEADLTLTHDGNPTFMLGGGVVHPGPARANSVDGPDCARIDLQVIPAGGVVYRVGIYCGEAVHGDPVRAEVRFWLNSPSNHTQVAGHATLAGTVE